MAFEAGFSRRVEAHATGAPTPTEGVEEKPSLQDLLESDESKQFDYFLKATSKSKEKDAWSRYADGKPKAADEKIIQKAYDEYHVRKDRFDKVHQQIMSSTADMLQYSSIFKKFREFKGADNVDYVIENGLRDLALKNPKKFAEIEKALKKVADQKKEEADFDKKIKEFADKHGITDEAKMRDAMTKLSEPERRAEIEKMLMEGKGLLDRIGNWFSQASEKKAREISSEDLNRLNTDRAATYKELGRYTRNLLVNTKDMREALARTHMGKEPKFLSGSEALPTFTQIKNESREFNEEAVLRHARAFRADPKNAGIVWSDPKAVDAAYKVFQKEQSNRTIPLRKKSFLGLIAAGLSAIFDPKTEQKIKQDIFK